LRAEVSNAAVRCLSNMPLNLDACRPVQDEPHGARRGQPRNLAGGIAEAGAQHIGQLGEPEEVAGRDEPLARGRRRPVHAPGTLPPRPPDMAARSGSAGQCR
jgi:hypothetical protein